MRLEREIPPIIVPTNLLNRYFAVLTGTAMTPGSSGDAVKNDSSWE
jgi:hypothetical protein